MDDNNKKIDVNNEHPLWKDLVIFGAGLMIIGVCIKGIFFD